MNMGSLVLKAKALLLQLNNETKTSIYYFSLFFESNTIILGEC